MLADVLYSAIVAVCAFVTGYRLGLARKYVYGTCGGPGAGRHARKRRDGTVEKLVIGYVTEFWHPVDEFWWPTFTPYPDQ